MDVYLISFTPFAKFKRTNNYLNVKVNQHCFFKIECGTIFLFSAFAKRNLNSRKRTRKDVNTTKEKKSKQENEMFKTTNFGNTNEYVM